MDERITKLLQPMHRNPGGSPEALERLKASVGSDLPEDYLGFLTWCNGAVGDMLPTLDALADRSVLAWVESFSAEEVLEYAKSEWSIPQKWRKVLPGYLGIGCSGRHVAFINLHSDQDRTGLYAIGYHLSGEDQFPLLYQLETFTELIEHLSTLDLNLRVAHLDGLNLRGACLLGAQLDGAALVGADLTGADLRNASVVGADFTNAKLANVRLKDALYEPHTRWPIGFDPRSHGAQLTWDEEACGGQWPKFYEEFYRSLGRT